MQFLDQGRIDLVIATMADTDERRDMVQIVDPSYYASGTNILTKGTFTKWEDLAGVPVCGVQGTVYNRKLAEQYGAEIVAFKGAGAALTALKQSRSEERRVGEGGVSTCRSRGAREHKKKKN